MSLPTFTLTSASTSAAAPFALGHAFVQGDVPAGSQVVAPFADFQVTAKSAWPDGSLKFAILAGRAAITGGTPLSVALSIGTPTAGSALTTTDLKATGITASIGCGTPGIVSWATTDWDSPFATWASGPKMSIWVYRKAVGSDAHLVGWLEVRLWAGGEVEVLPWIENGYLNVAGPTSKSATYSFTLGGTSRFSAAVNLPHHCRTPLVSGATLSHWLGTDPGVTATHDKAYLQSSRMVPAYRASVDSGSSAWTGLPSTYTPLQQGSHSPYMPDTGYSPAIGLLPEWDVLYLTSNDARAYPGVIFNAYSAGRYAIHYRDETTQHPLKLSSYPHLVPNDDGGITGINGLGASTPGTYTPSASGTTPPVWDTPHHPALAYCAYLLTGRFYFMEEVQFIAAINAFKTTDWSRNFGDGVIKSSSANTTRGAGWAIRTLAMAAAVTPDADTALRPELVASLTANIDFYHAMYIAMPNNPQGFVEPYSDYTAGDGVYMTASWMEDFFCASVGMAIDLAIVAGTTKTKLEAFFAWKAQAIVGRLGGTGSTAYLYCDGAPYTVAIAPTDTPDFTGGTGPWYSNWGEIYAATMGVPNPGVGGDLRGAYYPDATSYWGNLQPAIAYAVRHGVDGADAAYARMTEAPNWDDFVASANDAPVWSVEPLFSDSGGVVTTPGPSFVWDSVPLMSDGFVWDTIRGLGMRAQDIPSTGTDGAPPWYNDLDLPADNDSEIWISIDAMPTLGGELIFDGLGGFSYDGPADSFTWTGYQDGADMGSAVVTLLDGTSTVTGVTVSPSTATGSTTFTAVVAGAGSPSQVVNWSTDGGSITSGGVFTAPVATTSIQIITVTGRSAQNAAFYDTATVTIAAADVVTTAPRYARPSSDVSAGSWLPSTGTVLAAMIDEAVADSSDYIRTTVASACTVALNPVADPGTSSNQTVRYQAWSGASNALTVQLKQGASVIASWVHTTLPTTPTVYEQSLSAAECNAITDYTDLRLTFTAA